MDVRTAALIGFVVVPAACVALERRWPSMPARTFARPGVPSDAIFYVFQSFVARRVAPWAVYFALVPLMLALGKEAPDFFRGFGPAARIPFWWQVPIVFVLADFLSYWQHRLFHTRALWRVHAVHHSSRQLDWLSSGRFHPLNEVGVQLVVVAPVLACGFHAATFLVLAPFTTWYAVFLHANVPWSFGPLRTLLASPGFHRWHHTAEAEGRDTNFGGVLCVWDVLFGTFYMPADRTATVFGTDDPVPEGFVKQLAYPLLHARLRAAPAGHAVGAPAVRRETSSI
jgi:sterol desaturase/sphingolipid hydroxylase (fatty acid hydroxylase superfamily)